MEMLKRALALLLVFAMLMPNLTTIAAATDTGEVPAAVSTEPVVILEETEAPTEQTEAPTEQTEAPTEQTEAPTEQTEAPTEQTEAPTEQTEAPAEETEPSLTEKTGTAEETVTAPAANAESVLELVTETATVENTAAPDSRYSNDDMFAMYVDRVLYPNKPSTLGTGGFDNLPDEKHQNLYAWLKDQLATVAAQGGSSVFTITMEDLAKCGFAVNFTAAELGGEDLHYANVSELVPQIDEKLDLDLDALIDALMADCPYELYWYDKTVGCESTYEYAYSYYTNTGLLANIDVTEMTFRFVVAKDYRSTSTDAYTVSGDFADEAAKTVDYALAVVTANESKSDYDKLVAYKDYICGQVAYNDEAAKEDYSGGYGDPWQIIHVFDPDSTTNVVCEGYAKAFQYLCDLSDFTGNVESFLVSGYADGAHMWNIVSIEGRNYLVDVTNSDAEEYEIAFGEGGLLFLAGTPGGIADGEGYTFTNNSFNPPDLTYTYYYDVKKSDGTTERIHPAVDTYGDDEDSILNLSYIGYEDYLAASAAQKEAISTGSFSDEMLMVDPATVEDQNFTDIQLTVSGTTLTISGYTELTNCSITLENGARLIVRGELHLNSGSVLNLEDDSTYLQINGDGTIYVAGESSVIAQNNAQLAIPDGTLYVDFYAVDTQAPDIAPEKLTVQTWVMDQASLRYSLNDMALAEGAAPVYHRYEIIANYSFTLEEDVTIPSHIAFELRNWGDWNDPVVLTIPAGVTMTIDGCYTGIYEGTRLQVEGALVDNGYLRIHENSMLHVADSGTVQVQGTLDNRGTVYAQTAEQLVIEDGSAWENNAPVYASEGVDSFITLRFLSNDGDGWYEDSNRDVYESVRMSPDQHFYMIAYLNRWNYETLAWDVEPIHATKLVADENLVLEPFEKIQDDSAQAADDQNVGAFFRVYAAEDKVDTSGVITYSNTDIQTKIELCRGNGGFYSANPTAAGADANSLWLNEFCVSEDNRTFWFYYDAAQDYETGWTVSEVTVETDREIGGNIAVDKAADNLYTITISDETAANIYALREFWLNLDYTLTKGEEIRGDGAEIKCRAVDFGDSNANFSINGQNYHASWNYEGLFTYQQNEEGDSYPVPATAPDGVSYDIHSNTLTLNGAKLETLHVTNHWYDAYNDREGWNLPDGQFTINLVGNNSITATDDHALFVMGDMHLVITGDGSLEVTLNGDDTNYRHSAFEANDADVTIEGNAQVTVNVSGTGFREDENGSVIRTSLTAFRSHSGHRHLRLRGNATLTTNVPAGSCINGYFDQDGNFVGEGGFHGIEVPEIEVNDNATLNTQTIHVWDEGLDNEYGAYYQNGGTVNISGMPYYNKDFVSEDGVTGHFHFSGVEADYGLIEINGGVLNLNMNATAAQMAKSTYFHGLQSRGRRIDLNGGQINVSGNIRGTGIKVGEDDWDGGTNAWVNFNNTELNMTGSKLYRCAIEVTPNGSINFNGGRINAHRSDVVIRGSMQWNGTNLNATESNLVIVDGSQANIRGGGLNIQNGNIIIDNVYDENGNPVFDESGNLIKSSLHMKGGQINLENGFVYVAGNMIMKAGALLQSVDYRKLTTSANYTEAMVIDRSGYLEIDDEAYLEINGTDKVDGIYNEGTFCQYGGTVAVKVDKAAVNQSLITVAMCGSGEHRFEGGYTYLEGYNALLQFNDANRNSRLYVGDEATLDTFGRGAGITTYAPAEFAGGNVTAWAYEAVAGDPYPAAVLVKNDDGGTNASLTISGGSHYFACFDEDALAANSRGLSVENASVALTGGTVDIEAETAVQNTVAEGTASGITVPAIISNENGELLELTYDSELKAYTLFVEAEDSTDSVARSVSFRMSQNCGKTEDDDVQWKIVDGVLTISGTGAMADYHMPINDPDSWRVAPWYSMRDAITKVVVEEGITGIGYWAFGRLPEVTEIMYPATMTELHLESGYACPKLEKVTIAQGNPNYYTVNDGQVIVETGEDGDTVLAAVQSVTSYTADDHIIAIGMGAFDSTKLVQLDLNQVTEIGNMAFADCYDLKEVVIPEGITTIGLCVFQNSGLETVTIPVSVTKIRNYAFDGCTALANVHYAGSENAWNAIVIGCGNNALTNLPINFMGTDEAAEGEPYLSYHLLRFGDQGYFEDASEAKTEMTIPVGYYPAMVVYSNVWNEDAQKWERSVVDPEQLYSDAEGLDIGPFRYYQNISIAEGEPNAEHFFEMAFHSGWNETRNLCYQLSDGTELKLPVKLTRSKVGFYSADPSEMTEEERDAAWLSYYPLNPNITGHSIYLAVTDGTAFTSVTVNSERLSEAELALVTCKKADETGTVYQIALADALAAQVFEKRGIPIQVTYTIGDQTETLDFFFGSPDFSGECCSFVINGIWYEYYPGLEGYFGWDNENQKRYAYKELPGGLTYDYESDTLTMTNSTIESLQVYWNWHNGEDSGYATKDSDLTLKLVGENKIINPNSNAALAVGDDLTMTITSEENGTLLISATNENATANNFSQSAVNIYNGADLVIAGNASVTTSIASNANMTGGWLMNMWGNGNNTVTVRDNATLTTTVPQYARDDGDLYVEGFAGIDWFGEIRVQDNAKLNTTTLRLGEYSDENKTYLGKGSYIQTGGTVTIEALGHQNEEGRYNYIGFDVQSNNHAEISGGKLIVKANADNVQADTGSSTYAWFDGINVNGNLEISGTAEVEIVAPDDGTGISVVGGNLSVPGGTVTFAGNGCDNVALEVNYNGNVQLNGGYLDFTDSKVCMWANGRMEINGGTLSVTCEEYPQQTYMMIMDDSEFILHDGVVVVNNGVDPDGNNAVFVNGTLHLNGGIMTVSGHSALAVLNGELHQNGAELTVSGNERVLMCDGTIYLNGGVTKAVLGIKTDGGEIELFSLTSDPVINSWSSAVKLSRSGYLEVNGGHHSFLVEGIPGVDEDGNAVWLAAMDVNGTVNFNGGTVELDAGTGGQAIFNRNAEQYTTVHFNNNLGAVSLNDGTGLAMYPHGSDEDSSKYYFALGTAENTSASNARILETAAGHNASWRIEKDAEQGTTTLIISGSENMTDYYMPEGDTDWRMPPWYDYKDQITHVVVEDGINHIGDWVFARMTALVNVKLPASVNHISTSAFYGCGSLESFTMPGNDNYYLDENTRTGPDENGCYTGNVIIEGGWKVLLAAPSVTAYEVPAYISEIGNGAFQNCPDLNTLTFGAEEDGKRNIWNIGNNAFAGTALTEITIPEGVQSIGRSAFEDCGSLTSISLPGSVNAIRPYAFSGCSKVTAVTYAGSESDWNKISIGSGNSVLDQVTFLSEDAESGEAYLSFRWLDMDENGWKENQHVAARELGMAANATIYGVFYYNCWDETNNLWTAEAVIPVPEENSGITIQAIAELDEQTLQDFGWKIDADETNGAYFVMVTSEPDSWDVEGTNKGIVSHEGTTLDIAIARPEYGFYSGTTASNDTWLNEYELNPLKTTNEFYFIFEGSDDRIMDDSSFHIWNHNGIPSDYIRAYDVGLGIFKIVLDPIFLQDAWEYGHGFQLFAGFDVVDGENRNYQETKFQLKTMNLGNPDAILEIDDTKYLYFKDENGWMTYGDPANDWRPGVTSLPAGVSYDYDKDTLTLTNAKLNNLGLTYKVHDGEGNLTGETMLRNGQLTLNLNGSSVIESGHRNALRIDGNLNVTVSGSGSLYLHSHNDPENRNDEGNLYAFDTVEVETGSTLTIAGGTVTAEISGDGYWNNDHPAMPAALRGRHNSNLVITGGSLTTVVPHNARDNGPEEVDFEDYYSTHAISEFSSITVEGGVLNTTSLYVNSGESYKQTGGTVNITGLGHMSWQWDENGNRYRNYHYNGLQIQQGASADISGGNLNLTVTCEDWENGSGSYYNGLSIAGGTAKIGGDAVIHVTGAYDGNAVSVGYDRDNNGQISGYGALEMTGGTLILSNKIPGTIMNGLEVNRNCTANISGGTLDLTPADSFAGINNMGTLNIGTATIDLTWAVTSSGELTVDGATIDVTHEENTNMYAWDIVPGTRFDFISGTINGKHAAFWIGGEMNIGADAVLNLEESDFHADGKITLDGTMSMTQADPVDNHFLGMVTDEWGNTREEYMHQSRLYVAGALNLNGGSLTLENVPVNMEGSSVVNQNGTTVTMTNTTATPAERRSNDYGTDDWMVSVRMDEGTALNINSGTFTMTNTNFDNGLESNGMIHINGGETAITMTNADANSALRSNGDLNMCDGTLTIRTEGFAALASQGQTHISGGTVILSGETGYHLWYEKGFENGKLTVTGGTIHITAKNTGFDLYNDMVVTGGTIDVDVTGVTRNFTDDVGVPLTMLAGCGIMGYNEEKAISVSINGGVLDIDAPVDVPAGYNAASVYGILGGRNTTVRINGGDVSIKGKTALYAESQENAKHVLINNRMHVLSLDTGNTLEVTTGIVKVENDGKTYTWYVDTYEEDGIWTSPLDNYLMEGYASNLRLVSKSAGTNAVWNLQDGTLTITASSDKITGTMAKAADWSHVADKITKVVIDPSIETVDTDAFTLMENLTSVKVPHGSAAETYAKDHGISVTYFHEPEGDNPCTYEGCALTTFITIVEDEDKTTTTKVEEVQQIDTEALKQELETYENNAKQYENLDTAAKNVNPSLAVVVKAEKGTADSTVSDMAEDAEIVGAAMNADAATTEVALVIGESSEAVEIDETQYEKVIRFSMELTATTTTAEGETTETLDELKAPVKITLPLAADVDPERLVILHYLDDGSVENVGFTTETVGEQKYVSFWLSSFCDVDFLVTPEKLSVVLDSHSITYGDTVPELTYQVLDEDGNTEELPDGVTVTVNTVNVTKAGTYTITATVNKGDVACDITVVPGTLTVAKQQFTVTMDSKEMTIGDAQPAFTYTVADDKTLPAGILIKGKAVGDITKAGTYTITADPVESDYYAVTVKDGKLTVKKQQVTVTMHNQSMHAGDSFDLSDLTYTVTDANGNVLTNHGLEITTKINLFDAYKGGIYTINAVVEKHDQYEATVVDGTMTVIQNIEVTIADATANAGDAMPTFDFTVPEGVDKDSITLNYKVTDADGTEITELSNAGEYTITAEAAEHAYYNITVVNGTLTVDENVIIFTDTVNHSVLYKDKIQIQYHFNLADSNVEVTKFGALIWTAAEYEAELEAFGTAKTGKLQYTSDNVYDVELVKQSGRYRADNEGQKPRELHVEYYAVPYAIVDGEYFYGNADLYSVQQYADDILTKSSNVASRSTVEAMMRFAKYTQIYLGDTENVGVFESVLSKHGLATNVEWTDSDASLLKEQIVVTQPEYSTNFTAWAGTSLLMKDQTGLGFVLKGQFEDTVEVLYWNESDYADNSTSLIKGTESGVLETIAYSTKYDQALKTGISARLSEDVYYVRMYNTTTGEYSEVKADSVATNLTRMVNKYSDGSNDKALYFAQAYLKYAATAKAYLGN